MRAEKNIYVYESNKSLVIIRIQFYFALRKKNCVSGARRSLTLSFSNSPNRARKNFMGKFTLITLFSNFGE